MIYPQKIAPEKETKKITEFIKETFKKAGKEKAVIAVSGGVDYSTTLILTTKALSPKNVHVLHLPAKTTDPVDLEDLKLVTKLAKVPKKNITTINITGIIQKTWRTIKRQTTFPSLVGKSTTDRKQINQQIAELNRLRLANLAARVRMIVIFDQAKLHDALVIGTENRSEHLLGYYTRFGDEASDLEPIRNLYKTQVIQLAKYLKIPNQIIKKPPTAGLWKGQTDEAELGFSYEQADPILYLKIEQKLSPKKIIDKLSKNTQKNSEEIKALVTKVLNRVRTYSFKHQLPYQI
jgi:NAD+ synthase